MPERCKQRRELGLRREVGLLHVQERRQGVQGRVQGERIEFREAQEGNVWCRAVGVARALSRASSASACSRGSSSSGRCPSYAGHDREPDHDSPTTTPGTDEKMLGGDERDLRHDPGQPRRRLRMNLVAAFFTDDGDGGADAVHRLEDGEREATKKVMGGGGVRGAPTVHMGSARFSSSTTTRSNPVSRFVNDDADQVGAALSTRVLWDFKNMIRGRYTRGSTTAAMAGLIEVATIFSERQTLIARSLEHDAKSLEASDEGVHRMGAIIEHCMPPTRLSGETPGCTTTWTASRSGCSRTGARRRSSRWGDGFEARWRRPASSPGSGDA